MIYLLNQIEKISSGMIFSFVKIINSSYFIDSIEKSHI